MCSYFLPANQNTLTNQNASDVTAVFTYSHLSTTIDQCKSACYPSYLDIILVTLHNACNFNKNRSSLHKSRSNFFLSKILLSQYVDYFIKGMKKLFPGAL